MFMKMGKPLNQRLLTNRRQLNPHTENLISNFHKRKKYTEYYTPELQQLVYLMYEKDFELFGYSKEFN